MATYKGLSVVVLAALVSGLSACGGGGGGGGSVTGADTVSAQPTNEGVFLDSAVANIAYRTATQSGFTNTQGKYLFLNGENVIFSIGGIDLPPTPAKGVITPLDIMDASSVNDPAVINLSRLLQSLDRDGNPDNGIQISDEAHAVAANMVVNFDSDFFEDEVKNLVASSGAINKVLIDAVSAIGHLNETLQVIGVETDYSRFLSASVSQQSIPAGVVCPAGGIELSSGFDINQNGLLDIDEVTETQVVCHGETGLASLFKISDISDGNHCPASGKEVSSGFDQNDDGLLQEGEVIDTVYICDGQIGADGLDGYDALVNLVAEPAGVNCPAGGQKIENGQDLNRDGSLQESEVLQTRYVCNGVSAPDLGPVLVKLTDDDGSLCLHAGTVSSVGNDTNRNGFLDDSEVTSTSHICRENTAPYLSLSGYGEKDSENRFLAYSGVGIESTWQIQHLDGENDFVTMTIGDLPSWLTYQERTEENPQCAYMPCDSATYTIREFKGTPSSEDKGVVEVAIHLTDGESDREEIILIEVADPVVFSITDNIVVTEGVDQQAEIQLSLSAPLDVDIVVGVSASKPFSVCDESGCESVPGYGYSYSQIQLKAGETLKTIRFDIVDDQVYSSALTASFSVVYSHYNLESRFLFNTDQTQERVVNIIDNDPKPMVGFGVSESSYTLVANYISVPLSLSHQLQGSAEAFFEFGGTAINGVDYTVERDSSDICCGPSYGGYLSLELANAEIEESRTIEITMVSVVGDVDIDANKSTHVITLIPPVYPEVSFAEATSSSSFYNPSSNSRVSVLLSEPVDQDVSVSLAYSGAALEYVDQNSLSSSLNFYSGSFSREIYIPYLGGSLPNDVDLTITMSSVQQGVLGAISSHTLTLRNSQPYGVVSIVPELENGTLEISDRVIHDGFVYMTGSVQGTIKDQVYYGGNSDFFIGKFDLDGTPVWVKQLGSEVHDTSYSIAIDSIGNILLARAAVGNGTDEMYLEKYSNDGDAIWQKLIGPSEDSKVKLLIDSQDHIVVTINGQSIIDDQDPYNHNFYIEKRNADGALLWQQNDLAGVHNSSSYRSYSGRFALDSGNNIVMAATTNYSLGQALNSGGYDIAVIKFNGTTGDADWGQLLGPAGYGYLSGLTLDDSDNIFFATRANSGFEDALPVLGQDIVLAKLNTLGETVWVRQFGTFGSDYPGEIVHDGNGGVYLGAYIGETVDGDETGGYLFRFDSEGSQLAKVYTASHSFNIDGFYYYYPPTAPYAAISLSASGDLFVHDNGMRIRKFDSNLNPL